MNKKSLPTFLVAILILILNLSSRETLEVFAQAAPEGWNPPVNLSRSGDATAPILVVDYLNHIHVVWKNSPGETKYAYWDGQTWEAPKLIETPFGRFTPRLFSDPSGNIHAFWITETDDLRFSHVRSGFFSSLKDWSTEQTLANSIVDYDLNVDRKGKLHLVYISQESSDIPAGVYYRSSSDGGNSWSNPIKLYQTQYFSNLHADKVNLHIVSSDAVYTSSIYVVWDNRPRKRIYFTRSDDAGLTWDSPSEIDKPEINTGSAGPFSISIGARENFVFLVWEWGQFGSQCTQYYQFSTDSGKTWGERQKMPDGINSCLQHSQFIPSADGILLIQTTVRDQVFLRTWDGTQWSSPQLQQLLSSFTDQETYDIVDLKSQKFVLNGDGNLYVVGYDSGNGRDVWVTWRAIGSLTSLVPQQLEWGTPFLIGKSLTKASSLHLITDNEGRSHAFWSQKDETSQGELITSIYYSREGGGNWSEPSLIHKTGSGDDIQLTATVDSRDRLLLVWKEDTSVELFFSWANAGQAGNASEWIPPQSISLLQPFTSSPQIVVDHGGTISIVYSIMVNEYRGIYLTHSTDLGKTWSTPAQIFNGAAEKWEIVDQPQLLTVVDGQFHLLWLRRTSIINLEASSLFYSRSDDGGQTWSTPENVVNKTIVWSKIVGINDQAIHRLWLEWENNQANLFHQYSIDNGHTWSAPIPVTFNAQNGPINLVIDGSGQLHLLQVLVDQTNNPIIQQSDWDGNAWTSSRSPFSGLDSSQSINEFSATISDQNKLVVVYSKSNSSNGETNPQYLIQSINKVLEIPSSIPVMTPVVTTAITQPVEPTSLSTLQPVPTPTLPVVDKTNTAGGTDIFGSPYVLGVVPAFLIIGFSIILSIYLGKRRRIRDR